MRYCIIDLETTIKKSFKRTANPFDPMNRIVLCGTKVQGENISLKDISGLFFPFQDTTVYVGHNIKFDLLHLYTHNNEIPDYKYTRPIQIWDTQLAEYILTGYEHKMSALRDIAVNKYGCPYREKKMEMFWEKDICTSQIPKAIVEDDLKYDLLDTEQVFLGQVKRAKDLGLIGFIKTQMDALLATTEMEFNGLYVDLTLLQTEEEKKHTEIMVLYDNLANDIKEKYWKLPVEFNLNSRDHISILLFGGSLTIKEKDQVGFFKNGNPKFKLIDHSYYQNGIVSNFPTTDTSKEGIYKVDESVLTEIDHPFVKALLEYRKLAKDYGTYYEGLLALVNPIDNCIHHQLLHVTTTTGRLSSRDPNMQNIPRKDNSEIKKVFTSRFGGSIVEFDYSQLEVRIAACVYNDVTLLEELNNNIDLYKVNATWFYNKTESEVTKEERQIVKGFILGILYGKGSYSLAKESGLEQEDCQEFIKKFYEKYTNIAHHHTMILDFAQHNKTASNYLTKRGKRANICKYKTVLGNILTFVETDAPEFVIRKTGEETSFNPPDLKNHPIQSIAGNLVLIMASEVYRYIQKVSEVKLINTVHDSIMLDIQSSHMFMVKDIQNILESVNKIVKTKFDLEWKCKFPVDMKVGNSWYDC